MRRNAWAIALAASIAALCVLSACGRAPKATAVVPPPVAPPLIAREALFGDPARTDAQIAPQGAMIAFLAPHEGALNLWVVSTATLGVARPLTSEAQGVAQYRWSADGAHLLYLTPGEGETMRLVAVDAASGESKVLTSEGAPTFVGISPTDAAGVVITLNDRDRAWADLYRVDIASGVRTLLDRNTRRFFRYVVDGDNHVRLGLKALADGSQEIWSRGAQGRWARLFAIPFEDTLSSKPLEFESGGRSFLMLDSTGRDRAGLVRVDAQSGAKTVLGESQRADIVDVWLDPSTQAPQAYAADYLRREWRALDASAQADLTYLDAQLEGEPRVVSRTLDDKVWIVVEDGPATPARSWLYERGDPQNRKLTLLFRHRPALEGAPLQPMIPIEIESRDGLTLVSYLTLPLGSDANGDSRPDAPAPLVILPHDGPWDRDSYGFNPLHQWLANRGYAVLSVNFRGSTGLGKAFLNQGNGEWGAKMQEDILDAVQWAVEEGVAQPDRIAIMGESFGGYAALNALTLTPQRFACGVDLSGPSDLESYLSSLPASLEWSRASLYLRVGDPRTPEGRQLLHDRSPLYRAAAIERALLIAQGARDPRSARANADIIAQAQRARRAGLVYLLYPDAGRIISRTADRLSFYAAADQFLNACLHGRAESLAQGFAGAHAQALVGADRIEGLARLAPSPPTPPQQPAESPTPMLTDAPGDPAPADGQPQSP
ncbi:MAG: prolyl oligopeptidase family serine peptidase [Hyphomonadaceae bacterium]